MSEIKIDFLASEFAVLVKWPFVEFCLLDNQGKTSNAK